MPPACALRGGRRQGAAAAAARKGVIFLKTPFGRFFLRFAPEKTSKWRSHQMETAQGGALPQMLEIPHPHMQRKRENKAHETNEQRAAQDLERAALLPQRWRSVSVVVNPRADAGSQRKDGSRHTKGYVDEEGDLCTAAQGSAKQALKLIPDSHGDPPITRRYTHLLSWVFAKRAIRVNGSRMVFRPLEIS